jgi:hypothetical protein
MCVALSPIVVYTANQAQYALLPGQLDILTNHGWNHIHCVDLLYVRLK